jgi:F-type H+-transporting ATPase subunit delta
MFVAERWAQAFINALGEAAEEEGLAVFRALLAGFEGVHVGGAFTGQLEGMIRAAMKRSGLNSRGAEYACRLTALLARRHYFKYAGLLARSIALVLDRRRGIVPVLVEVPFPPDKELQDVLEETLQERMGQIRLDTRIVPELIGGCRLRIGSDLFDASIRGQLKKMAADLGKEGGSW